MEIVKTYTRQNTSYVSGNFFSFLRFHTIFYNDNIIYNVDMYLYIYFMHIM